LIGGLCGLVIYASRPLGWLLSTLAGLVLGISLAAVLGITQLHCVCLLAALLAASFAKFCDWMEASPVVAIGGEALSEGVQRQRNRQVRERTA
jgi:bacteriorhodopsin